MSSVAAMTPTRFHGRTVTSALPVRPRPTSGRWDIFWARDGRAAIIAHSVLEVVRSVERLHAPCETGGILFGRCFRDAQGEYVLVTHAERPAQGEVLGTVSTVTITAEGAAAMAYRALTEVPLADVVGWYHSHPTYTAYFSEVDRAEQRRWPSSLAVGLVMSGLEDAEPPYRVFVGPESASTHTAYRAVAGDQSAGRSAVTVALPPPRADRRRSDLRRRRAAAACAAVALALSTVLVAWTLMDLPASPRGGRSVGKSTPTRAKARRATMRAADPTASRAVRPVRPAPAAPATPPDALLSEGLPPEGDQGRPTP